MEAPGKRDLGLDAERRRPRTGKSFSPAWC
jgi:hypothetical protein